MNEFFATLDNWAKKHHPKWIDALRMVLGIIIIAKTIIFIGATAPLLKPKWLLYTTVTIGMLGGTLIFIGLQTRIIAMIQTPAVLVALIYSITHINGFFLNSEILLSVIILFLLAFFFVEGSGTFSVDEEIRNSYKSTQPSK